MNHIGEFLSMNDAYFAIIREVRERGFSASPRGHDCKELRPATFTIAMPRLGIYTGVQRKLNTKIIAVEFASYVSGLGGRMYADLLSAVAPNFKRFVNKSTGELDGAYGPRISWRIRDAVASLSVDAWTRQALIPVWGMGDSPSAGSLDLPCTTVLHPYFDLEGRLEMLVHMRSNDVNWGTPYDVASFTLIQRAIAASLSVKLGKYVHVASSLHEYEDNAVKTVPPPFEEKFPDDGLDAMFADVVKWDNADAAILGIQASCTLFLAKAYAHVVLEKGSPRSFVAGPAESESSVVETLSTLFRGWS